MTLNLEHGTLNLMEAYRTDAEILAHDLEHAVWEAARPVGLTRYWSGVFAPPERHAEARAVWSDEALCVRFDCRQAEPPVINRTPQVTQKTNGLWERDVCEIFIAPDAFEPERYFEFEIAPTGEWLDLAIRQLPDRRETDWGYASGMTAAAHIREGRITMAMRLPWQAFGRAPQRDERWRVNLFRCIGSGAGRGYLAWQPTRTAQPNFHVPQAFGWLFFS